MNERQNGKVVMTRLDPCLNRLWSFSYSLASGYLELRDVYINPSDDILAYGSYFTGMEEHLFLLSINGSTGKNAEFQIYDPKTTNGYFAYSLNPVENHFIVYGYLINPDVGFVAHLDESLNPLWAKKLEPFNSNGASIIDNQQSIVARSGHFLFRMDLDGNLLWSKQLNFPAVKGPLEAFDGYVFVGHNKGVSFFFLVDHNGLLKWRSDEFEAVESSGAITLLNAKEILFTYNCPDGDENYLCQFLLSDQGKIFDHRQLIIEGNINSGLLTQAINEANQMTIVGNANAFVPDQPIIKDFILQFSLDEMTEDCFRWTEIKAPQINNTTIDITSMEMVGLDFELEMTEKTSAFVDTFLYSFSDVCDLSPNLIVQRRDTTLACGEVWIASIPKSGFRWLDGSSDNPRQLTNSGVYKARSEDCIKPIEIEFNLRTENCDCQIYIPNAFSPNQDGLNDVLTYFSSCPLSAVRLSIFNRVGKRVFFSDGLNQSWDGTYQQKRAEPGVYVIYLDYEWVTEAGQYQQNTITTDVTLLR